MQLKHICKVCGHRMITGTQTLFEKDNQTIRGYIDYVSCPNTTCPKAYESIEISRTPFNLATA